MVFTFGKYVGCPLHEVPASYLAMALEGFTIPEALSDACRAELLRRFGLTPPPARQTGNLPTTERIRQVYREMAKRHHPDKGGSHGAMLAINEFYQALSQ